MDGAAVPLLGSSRPGFCNFYSQKVCQNKAIFAIYLTAIAALVLVLTLHNVSATTRAIVGTSVAGAHLILLGVAFAYFRRLPPPPAAAPAPAAAPLAPADAPFKAPPVDLSRVDSLHALMLHLGARKGARGEGAIPLNTENSDTEYTEVLNDPNAALHSGITQCQKGRYNAYLIPVINNIHAATSVPVFILISETDKANLYECILVAKNVRGADITETSMNKFSLEPAYRYLNGIFQKKPGAPYHLNITPPGF